MRRLVDLLLLPILLPLVLVALICTTTYESLVKLANRPNRGWLKL